VLHVAVAFACFLTAIPTWADDSADASVEASNDSALASTDVTPTAPAATTPSVAATDPEPIDPSTPAVPAVLDPSSPSVVPGHWEQVGEASWYGPTFHGRPTASGELFDATARTVAHPFLPLGSIVEIENLANGHRSVARVNDRGPFSGGRVVDVSYVLAHELGFIGTGTAHVRVALLDSLAPAAVFAGRGIVPSLEEDGSPAWPYSGFYSRAQTFVGPPAPPDFDLASPSAGTGGLELRKASVFPMPPLPHAVHQLLNALVAPFSGMQLGLPKPLGLRSVVELFIH
jgi:rare lipoprotein A (peptidoglycan hydrolase)